MDQPYLRSLKSLNLEVNWSNLLYLVRHIESANYGKTVILKIFAYEVFKTSVNERCTFFFILNLYMKE